MNDNSYNDTTPLILAAGKGDTETVNILCEHGANVNQRDKNGWPPIVVAAESNKDETVRLLLEKGADFKTNDQDNKELARWKDWIKFRFIPKEP